MSKIRHFLGMACLIPGLVLMGLAFGLLGIPIAALWRKVQDGQQIAPAGPVHRSAEMVH